MLLRGKVCFQEKERAMERKQSKNTSTGSCCNEPPPTKLGIQVEEKWKKKKNITGPSCHRCPQPLLPASLLETHPSSFLRPINQGQIKEAKEGSCGWRGNSSSHCSSSHLFPTTGKQKGDVNGKVSLLEQITLAGIIIEFNREGPSTWEVPHYQNLFPQKVLQYKRTLFTQHRSLAILILMLLVGKVAAGNKLTAFS